MIKHINDKFISTVDCPWCGVTNTESTVEFLDGSSFVVICIKCWMCKKQFKLWIYREGGRLIDQTERMEDK